MRGKRLRLFANLGLLDRDRTPTIDVLAVGGCGLSNSNAGVLFHGPAAQGRAAAAAAEWGRVVGVFGDPRDGLNTEAVKEAAQALSSPTVGDRKGSVIVGPVDVLTRAEVMDALLKVLEETTDRFPRAFLWAWDVGSVRPTIRSRCLMEWCPGQITLNKKMLDAAQEIVDASLKKSITGVLSGFQDIRESWKDHGDDFLVAVVQVLSQRQGHTHLALWAGVRSLMRGNQTPTYGEVVGRFLP